MNRPRSDPDGLGAREAVICAASGDPGEGERRVQGELDCDEKDVIDCIDGVVAAESYGDDPDAREEFESTVAVDDKASAR